MDNRDVLQILASQVDIDTIAALSSTPVWHTLRQFASQQHFWYQRTEFLVKSKLTERQGDWKTAYYALEQAWNQTNRFTDAVIASTLAVQVLIQLGMNPALDRNSAIRIACSRGRTEVVKMLLEDGRVEPATGISYCLRVACQNGHTDVVQLLLQDGRCDPTVYNNYCILVACENGYLDIVRALLSDGRADPSSDNNGAVILAASNGHFDIVELLLADDRVDSLSVLRTARELDMNELVNFITD